MRSLVSRQLMSIDMAYRASPTTTDMTCDLEIWQWAPVGLAAAWLMTLPFRVVSWLFHFEPWCLQHACRVYAPSVSSPRWQGRFSAPTGPSPPASAFLKDVVAVTLFPLPGCLSFGIDSVWDLL